MGKIEWEIPRFPYWLLKKLYVFGFWEGYAGDIEEEFDGIVNREGRRKAVLWIWFHAIAAVPKAFRSYFICGGSMFNNYFKMALRHIKKYKGYSFINICGLAIGIASCLLIFLFVSEEISYDNYHKDEDRIFRISTQFKTKTFTGDWAAVGPAVGPFLKRDFPQVEYSARIYLISRPLVKKDDIMFHEERVFYTDQDLLNIFSINFLYGDPAGALTRPNTVILSERMAQKYFGQEIVVGKTLTINNEEFEITGVVENCPSNTHFKYELLVSLESFENEREFTNWGWTVFQTNLKL